MGGRGRGVEGNKGAAEGEDMGEEWGDILGEVGRRGACHPCLACATFLALGALHLGEPRSALRTNPPSFYLTAQGRRRRRSRDLEAAGMGKARREGG